MLCPKCRPPFIKFFFFHQLALLPPIPGFFKTSERRSLHQQNRLVIDALRGLQPVHTTCDYHRLVINRPSEKILDKCFDVSERTVLMASMIATESIRLEQ